MPGFYTRKGDEGYTDLLGGRAAKYAPRPEAIGTLDEASSQLGYARAVATTGRTRSILIEAQRDLYLLMAELAFTPELTQERYHIRQDQLDRIERETDTLTDETPLPPHFILPGDTLSGAALDVARTVVRRAERQLAKLLHDGELDNPLALAYLNRLSSLLFILARFEDLQAGVTPLRAKQEPDPAG
jgi:cob(I)alamin adenosyltransferase